MKSVSVYLVFDGNCEEAFTFYKGVFGTEPIYFRYAGMPTEHPIAKEDENKVMNVTLPINEHLAIMGCDQPSTMGKVEMGKNFNIILNTESREETEKFYNGLLEGGSVNMPLADTFWGAYFGMIIDKFGIHWMISYDLPKA